MNRILISAGTIVAVAVLAVGGTIAFYADTETSTGNIFTAGSIDLKVDHTLATYDGEVCVSNCSETGGNLIVNGGFETPVVTDNGGQYQIYPSGFTGWANESGAGPEIQRNSVAGDPHGGVQLVELDSTGSSAMSQTLVTVPGGKYRLHFWYSPRPGIPAGDNTIGFNVKVVSDSSVIISDTVGLTAVGGSNTSWTEHVYDFIAVDASTKVIFTDLGSSSNSLGGYIDDVSMFALNCTETGFPYGGVCHLWNEKDLTTGDTFWNFPDIKPGDFGTNVISLHVTSNDAYACLIPSNVIKNENDVVGPEVAAGDNSLQTGIPHGELQDYVEFFLWEDSNGDGVYQNTETILAGPGTTMEQIQTEMVALSLTGGGPTENVGLAWCAGNQTGPTIALPNTPLACDGNGMGNIAQTDSFTADFTAYAVQQRNNSGFTCASVNLNP